MLIDYKKLKNLCDDGRVINYSIRERPPVKINGIAEFEILDSNGNTEKMQLILEEGSHDLLKMLQSRSVKKDYLSAVARKLLREVMIEEQLTELTELSPKVLND